MKIRVAAWSDSTYSPANDLLIELVDIQDFSSMENFYFDFSFCHELKGKVTFSKSPTK